MRTAVLSGLIATPKILSLIPVLLRDTARPQMGGGLSVTQILTGLSGYWLVENELSRGPLTFESYAVVGFPMVLLGIAGFWLLYYTEDTERKHWGVGVTAAIVLGVALSMGVRIAYDLPVVQFLRVAPRGVYLVLLGVVLLAVVAIRAGERAEYRPLRVAIAVAVVLAAVNGVAVAAETQQSTGGYNVETGDQVAAALAATTCDDIWVEAGVPDDPEVGYTLTKEGYRLQVTYYGRYGQEYAINNSDGTVAFDALLVNEPISVGGPVRLTGQWGLRVSLSLIPRKSGSIQLSIRLVAQCISIRGRVVTPAQPPDPTSTS
ncbi:hypothetical protein ACFQL1_01610 [Halomicroarcula sp. GCM10025709]|uniref:hypothetical protein n=1 Tax=Halomicroarcula sp. GCM10025709 TaxID=3252669 RepID=UPI003614BA1C